MNDAKRIRTVALNNFQPMFNIAAGTADLEVTCSAPEDINGIYHDFVRSFVAIWRTALSTTSLVEAARGRLLAN